MPTITRSDPEASGSKVGARKRRRIVVIAPWYPKPNDPVPGVFVEQQVHALARLHDVAVIAPDYRGWRKVSRLGVRPTPRQPSFEIPVLRPLVIGVVPYSYRAQAPFFAAAVRRGLAELRESWGEPELLHAHVTIPTGHAAARAARDLGIPLVLTEHWGAFAQLARARGSSRLIRDALQTARRVVAVGPDLAREVRAAEPNVAVVVVGNAIDTDFYAEVGPPAAWGARPLRLLVIGHLLEKKGLLELLESLAIARAQGIESELAVVGDGPLRSELEQRADSLSIREQCQFDGVLDRSGVRSRLQWCDALMVASHHETFGVTVAEALSGGRPVIATRCGGPEFVMSDVCGRLVPVRDPAALAEAIVDLAEGRIEFDADLARTRMRERFGFEAVAEQLSDVYDDVLDA